MTGQMEQLTVDASTLVLWDLDYTLVFSGGVDKEAWLEVCSALAGVEATSIGDTPGRTDPQILLDTLVLAGVDTDEAARLLPRALEMEVVALRQRTQELGQRGRVMSGAREILTAFAGIPSVIQAPLTGNVKENAILKLEVFGLAEFHQFDCGAYGSDHTDRSTLVRIARSRASEKASRSFTLGNTLLVGDSALDMEAAVAGGATPVGVAAGRTSREELVRAGAAHVFADLSEMLSAMDSLDLH